MLPTKQEPVIAVGLIDGSKSVTIRLEGRYHTDSGRSLESGTIHAACHQGTLRITGALDWAGPALELGPDHPNTCQFSVETTIGIDFHWQRKEIQSFRGGLRLIPKDDVRLTVINCVPLETYLMSVICSEMKATSPPELAKAHAVISRSWLLAQLDRTRAGSSPVPEQPTPPRPERWAGTDSGDDPERCAERIRWTDREAHRTYDVCADDHCQRYQGIGRMDAPAVTAAISATRGRVLTWCGSACDARYSKCCGGVTEQFQTAWGDLEVPYLVAVRDCPAAPPGLPQLTEEAAARKFILDRPRAYCHCTDPTILGRVLNDYDLNTGDFFRWEVDLDADQASELVARKLGVELGRLVAIEPVERGPSGRLVRIRLTGTDGCLVLGKELEIRRALSDSHLYSSAFVVDPEGPVGQPDSFRLSGAGWGHGVGLCQIGAAVMACQGVGYEEILRHYYPGTHIETCY